MHSSMLAAFLVLVALTLTEGRYYGSSGNQGQDESNGLHRIQGYESVNGFVTPQIDRKSQAFGMGQTQGFGRSDRPGQPISSSRFGEDQDTGNSFSGVSHRRTLGLGIISLQSKHLGLNTEEDGKADEDNHKHVLGMESFGGDGIEKDLGDIAGLGKGEDDGSAESLNTGTSLRGHGIGIGFGYSKTLHFGSGKGHGDGKGVSLSVEQRDDEDDAQKGNLNLAAGLKLQGQSAAKGFGYFESHHFGAGKVQAGGHAIEGQSYGHGIGNGVDEGSQGTHEISKGQVHGEQSVGKGISYTEGQRDDADDAQDGNLDVGAGQHGHGVGKGFGYIEGYHFGSGKVHAGGQAFGGLSAGESLQNGADEGNYGSLDFGAGKEHGDGLSFGSQNIEGKSFSVGQGDGVDENYQGKFDLGAGVHGHGSGYIQSHHFGAGKVNAAGHAFGGLSLGGNRENGGNEGNFGRFDEFGRDKDKTNYGHHGLVEGLYGHGVGKGFGYIQSHHFGAGKVNAAGHAFGGLSLSGNLENGGNEGNFGRFDEFGRDKDKTNYGHHDLVEGLYGHGVGKGFGYIESHHFGSGKVNAAGHAFGGLSVGGSLENGAEAGSHGRLDFGTSIDKTNDGNHGLVGGLYGQAVGKGFGLIESQHFGSGKVNTAGYAFGGLSVGGSLENGAGEGNYGSQKYGTGEAHTDGHTFGGLSFNAELGNRAGKGNVGSSDFGAKAIGDEHAFGGQSVDEGVSFKVGQRDEADHVRNDNLDLGAGLHGNAAGKGFGFIGSGKVHADGHGDKHAFGEGQDLNGGAGDGAVKGFYNSHGFGIDLPEQHRSQGFGYGKQQFTSGQGFGVNNDLKGMDFNSVQGLGSIKLNGASNDLSSSPGVGVSQFFGAGNDFSLNQGNGIRTGKITDSGFHGEEENFKERIGLGENLNGQEKDINADGRGDEEEKGLSSGQDFHAGTYLNVRPGLGGTSLYQSDKGFGENNLNGAHDYSANQGFGASQSYGAAQEFTPGKYPSTEPGVWRTQLHESTLGFVGNQAIALGKAFRPGLEAGKFQTTEPGFGGSQLYGAGKYLGATVGLGPSKIFGTGQDFNQYVLGAEKYKIINPVLTGAELLGGSVGAGLKFGAGKSVSTDRAIEGTDFFGAGKGQSTTTELGGTQLYAAGKGLNAYQGLGGSQFYGADKAGSHEFGRNKFYGAEKVFSGEQGFGMSGQQQITSPALGTQKELGIGLGENQFYGAGRDFNSDQRFGTGKGLSNSALEAKKDLVASLEIGPHKAYRPKGGRFRGRGKNAQRPSGAGCKITINCCNC